MTSRVLNLSVKPLYILPLRVLFGVFDLKHDILFVPQTQTRKQKHAQFQKTYSGGRTNETRDVARTTVSLR